MKSFLKQEIIPLLARLILLALLTAQCGYLRAQAVHLEATGNYSGISFSGQYNNKPMVLDADGHLKTATQGLDQTQIHFTLMTPAKHFGIGIELPYHLQTPQFTKFQIAVPSSTVNTWGDLTIVAKYQFGIYQRWHFFHQQRLIKAVVGVMIKYNLPTSKMHHRSESAGIVLTRMNAISQNLSVGMVFHTDTEKYFRIHGHLASRFPVMYNQVKPGAQYHLHFDLQMVRLEIRDAIYPFLGLTAWRMSQTKWHDTPVANTAGSDLYLSGGLRSVWNYFSTYDTFAMFETGIQLKILQYPANITLGPALALYLATRFYLR